MPAFLADSGMPLWNELRTSNFAASVNFYQGLFGWMVETQATPGYGLALSNGLPVAGIIDAGNDVSPQWMTAFYAPDLTVTYRQALQYGATDPATTDADAIEGAGDGDAATREPQVIDGPRGRMVPLVDPAGAPIALIHPPAEPFAAAGEAGTPMWHELTAVGASDQAGRDKVFDFYANVCDWDLMVQGEGDEQIATAVVDGAPFASVWFPTTKETEQLGAGRAGVSRWSTFFGVHDAQAAADYTEHNGGSVLVAPSDSPLGRMLVIQDPGGAYLTLVEAPEVEEETVHEGDNIFDSLG